MQSLISKRYWILPTGFEFGIRQCYLISFWRVDDDEKIEFWSPI